MPEHAEIAATASLIAEPARTAMLVALLDGSARPAGELAHAAGVTAQTASTHLARLVQGRLLVVETEGRHRYYRLNGPEVAQALEHLAGVGGPASARRPPLGKQARSLQFARCCYDHLAGQLGVAVAQALQRHGYVIAQPGKRCGITPAGEHWFSGMGLDVRTLRPTRNGLARLCLDWTERTHHVGGPLGVAMLAAFCERGWLRRTPGSRALTLTPPGRIALREQLGVEVEDAS
ncbi:transcriptional regulator [Pigmentiphaga sp. H8]|uniref:ArsR/SmtB family transcription factor n=1 Tax=Pigmentiphaga sp. H8 TaxID=2488560 RepID=UPI000F5B6A76|nr:helix-turn-helix transcriptional regulator [Pigmentiphaga sp. H8]AZG07612.1 transcriptional regulator [Pigmentiphaga sp. H8]